jgi:hypothetical protein
VQHIKRAASWLIQAVRRLLAWVASWFRPAPVKQRRLPLGARVFHDSSTRGTYINPLRQLRRKLEREYPHLKSGRQWVRFRKGLKRRGLDIRVLARLAG